MSDGLIMESVMTYQNEYAFVRRLII